MSLTYGANATTFFAKARIIGLKDEDRDHHDLKEGIRDDSNIFEDISSFAVFDGHGGKMAANICAKKLSTAFDEFYLRNTNILSKVAEYPFATVQNEDVVDALNVKAIHDSVSAVHEASVKESETAGTTLCSLFMVPIDHQKHVHDMRQSSAAQATAEPWQPPQADTAAAELGLTNTANCGQSYKVMCANVGDSRCVMVGCSAEPVKVSRRGATISGGNSSNNPAALAVENRASQPTTSSLSRSAKSFASLSSTNLSALGSMWGTHNSKVSESNQPSVAVNNNGGISTVAPPTPPTSSPRGGPSLSIINPFDRLKRSLAAYSRSEEEKVDGLDSTLHSTFPANDDQVEEEELPAAGTTMQVSVRVVPLSEDHKPSNKRERFRVEQRVQIGQQVLPIPLKAFDQKDEDFVQLFYHRYFNQSSPSSDKSLLQSFEGTGTLRRPEAFVKKDDTADTEHPSDSLKLTSLYKNISREFDLVRGDNSSAADNEELWPQFKNQLLIDFGSTIFGSNIRTPFLRRVYEVTKVLQHLLGDEVALKDINELKMPKEAEAEALKLIREDSCFKNRMGRDGASGPEAYFPRFSNNSLLMTRSVGDRNGPRGCLARADITSVTVHATQHARFVLASDGVWDVIDEEFIRKMGLYYKYKDPRDLAIYLAEKAVKRRTKQGLSKDDITLFVIDVNPQNAVFIKTAESKGGNHYYPAYHMNAAKKWTPMKSSVLSSAAPSATLSPKKVSPYGENAIPITTIDIADYSNNAR